MIKMSHNSSGLESLIYTSSLIAGSSNIPHDLLHVVFLVPVKDFHFVLAMAIVRLFHNLVDFCDILLDDHKVCSNPHLQNQLEVAEELDELDVEDFHTTFCKI